MVPPFFRKRADFAPFPFKLLNAVSYTHLDVYKRQLRLSDAGKTVTLVGWMENIREVGSNFAVVLLRDFYGTTQVVIENEAMMAVVKPCLLYTSRCV